MAKLDRKLRSHNFVILLTSMAMSDDSSVVVTFQFYSTALRLPLPHSFPRYYRHMMQIELSHHRLNERTKEGANLLQEYICYAGGEERDRDGGGKGYFHFTSIPFRILAAEK